MSDFKFEPSDFIAPNSAIALSPSFAALEANKKLAEWLEVAPVVYSDYNGDKDVYWIKTKNVDHYSFQARLVCIAPKEKCTHPKEKVEAVEKIFIQSKSCGINRPDTRVVLYKCSCGATVTPNAYEEIK